MDIHDLKAFLAIAEEGSFTKAAKSLHMSQPPLSRQMQNLESELGKPLFIRNTKGVILTEEGMILRQRAEEILGLFSKAEQELRSEPASLKGEIYIGAGESRHVEILAKAAKKLRDVHQGISFRLYAGDAARIEERLDEGLIDFGLLIGDFPSDKYEVLPLSIKDRWGVLMKKDDPLAALPFIKREDLSGKPIILSHQAAKNEKMSSFLGDKKEELQVTATYDLIHNASIFASEGLGYLLGLEGILEGLEEKGLAFRRLEPLMEANLYLVYKKGRTLSKAAQAYLGCIKEEMGLQ